jgi:hypothetical protein
MIKNLAIVKNGLVDNIIVVDDTDAATVAHFGGLIVPAEVAIGWTYSGGVFAAPVIPVIVLTLAETKAAKIASIKSAAQNALQAIVSPYPALEVSTWPNQYQEALDYTASVLAPTPTLTAIATAAGVTVATLVATVLAKANAFNAASGAAVGKRKLLTERAQAATTITEIEGIIW